MWLLPLAGCALGAWSEGVEAAILCGCGAARRCGGWRCGRVAAALGCWSEASDLTVAACAIRTW
eukprot:scaffold13455_cov57-Phaeocystis_antarctica.AAC.6